VLSTARRSGSRRLLSLLGTLLILGGLLPVAAAAPVLAISPNVVISEVYGGGGNTGSVYDHDYIELYNRGSSPVALGGNSVQYTGADTTSNFGSSSNLRTELPAFTLNPGQHFLIRESTNGGDGVPLPTPDYIDTDGAIAMALGAGKVVYVTGTTPLGCNGSTTPCDAAQLARIVDLVGYGSTATFYEGAGPTGNTSNTTAAIRGAGGATDTDNNNADFAIAAPDPDNSVELPPSVSAVTPAEGATNVSISADLTITFSEPVNVTNPWFTISCGTSGGHTAAVTGGPTTLTLNPDADFANSESCTVTVDDEAVSDQDSNDPPDTMLADFVFSFATVAAPPATPDINISEVYGGGGNLGATLKNDFIELYNPTTSAVPLAGWSVQYASAIGTTWAATNLAGSIPAGGYYLIKEAAGSGGTVELPTPDATGSIAMGATAGKVALVSNSTLLSGSCPTGTQIADLVGYGTTANCFEGAGPAPAPSNTLSIHRAGGGATDTENNATDFAAGTPTPTPSADPAPAVASTDPANGATGVSRTANIAITFSEPVNITGSWFTISCGISGTHTAAATGGPTAFDLNPDTDFVANENCTVTVLAANVADQDAIDPPDTMAANYVFSFTTIDAFCGDPSTPIHTVQGSGSASPLAGTSAAVEGIVVGDYQQVGSFGGFYLQEPDADVDADTATSEGIFVFTSTAAAVGDLVRATGTVTEFSNLTELSPVSSVLICSTGNALPTPAAVSLPVSAVADWERYEGMRIGIAQTLTATETFTLGRFGEVDLSVNGRLRNPTNVVAPGAPALALQDLNNRSRILLDDGDNRQNIDPTLYPQGGLSFLNTLRIGDTLPSLTGVLDQRFGDYRVQPVGTIEFSHDNARPPAPASVGGTTRVAAFNVLNYFNGNGTGVDGAAGGFPTPRGANNLTEFNRQRAKEITAITALNADVIGLMELENDDPNTENAAIEDLVAGLNAATAPGTYAFINTGIVGTDQIRVGIVYKPAAVTPVGAYQKIDSTVDPRFIDTKNRPSIAQTFDVTSTGARFTVVVNHLKSKGSDCLDVGDPDTGDGQGNCNLTRTKAAQALVDWIATDPTDSGDADFVLLGDMNAYAKEDPISAFKTGGFTDMIAADIGPDAYSYVFEGQSGYLDHGLASGSLAPQVTGVTEWHINADEPVVLDYNTEFKTANQINTFYSTAAYRSSDHDPVLIGLDLTVLPTLGTVTINKTGQGGAALAGAGFTLFVDAAPTGGSRGAEDIAAAGGCTTNSQGTCSITGIALATYWLVETTTPNGYATVAPTQVVVGVGPSPGVGDTDIVNLNDQAVPGTVTVNKTGQGGAALPAAGFTLFVDAAPTGGSRGAEDSAADGNCTTNGAGTCSISSVPLGQYWLVETTTPAGYATVNPNAVTVGLGPSAGVGDTDTFNLTDQPIPGTVVVNKTGQGGAALAGAGFTLFVDAAPIGGSRGAEDITAAGGCTTNSAGTCSITNVALRQYWLVETTTPNGYATVAPTAVTVGLGPSAGVGDTDTINLADVPVPGTVVVNKTGQGRAKIVGVTFTLYVDAAPVGGRRGSEDTTSAGSCVTAVVGSRVTCSITGVPLGRYWLVETVPAGNAPVDPIAVTISLGTAPNTGDTDTFSVKNKPKGSPKD
jgi:predicted extracellular nuclease